MTTQHRMSATRRSFATVLAVAALLACAGMAKADVCKKTTTVTDGPNGTTVIKTHTVCVVSSTTK
jgi:hypothetical protein